MDLNDPVVALLRRWLPGHDLAIDRSRSGGSTEVYRVRTRDDIYWLRLAEDPGEDRSVEYHAHITLRRLEVRVPDILMFEVAPPELDRSACLTSHISGIPFTEYPDQKVARHGAESAGRDLATINAVRTEGFGWIDHQQAGSPTIAAEHSLRADWATEYDNATERVRASNVIPANLETIFQHVMHDWKCQPASNNGHLVHGDFDATHIYVDPETGDYSGIIDFGEARGADSSYDLGHALLHDSEVGRIPVFDSIVSGWTGGTPDKDLIRQIRTQAVAIGTRQLSIMLERGQTFHRNYLTPRIATILCQIALED